jgi:hypothetical protein
MPVRQIFVIFSTSPSPPPPFYGPKSLERYDKSELSNQSSDEELGAQVFSVHFIPRGLTNFSPKTGVALSNITYSTGNDNATRRRKRHIAITS